MIDSIALDMDGVIYNWYINVRKLVCKEFALNWRDCPHPTQWGVPWMSEEHWDWYYANPGPVFGQGQPYNGAVEGVAALREICNKLTILTAANPEAKPVKRMWLEEWEVHYDLLRVVPLDFPKGSTIHYDLYIDDGLHNLEDVRGSNPGADLILVDRPWNRSSNEFIRARGWREIVEKAGELADSKTLVGRR